MRHRKNLMTGLYVDPHPVRAQENAEALAKNAQCGQLDEIHLFIEDSCCRLFDQRFKYHHVGKRTTFKQYFAFANTRPGELFIVSNSDISFDHTLAMLDLFDWNDTLICLTRSERHGIRRNPGLCKWMQDAWIFRSPIKPFPCDWELGHIASDGRLANEAINAGMRVWNPYPLLRGWHHHVSKIRRKEKRMQIPGKGTLVPPGQIIVK